MAFAKERKWKEGSPNADNTTATTTAAPSLNETATVNAAVPAVKHEDRYYYHSSGIELLQKRLDQIEGEFAEFERQVCWREERGMPTEPVIERILDLEKEQEQLIQQVRREEERLRREELLNEDASNQARWEPTVGNDSWSQYDRKGAAETAGEFAQPEMIGLQLMDLRFLFDNGGKGRRLRFCFSFWMPIGECLSKP